MGIDSEDVDEHLLPASADVFTDTNILLNYAQRVIEPDRTSNLVDGDQFNIVFGVTVADELEAINERRRDIYTDFLDFVLAEDGAIDEYDPSSRRPYFQKNDRQHIQNIQMRLAQLDDRAEVQRTLRYVTRSIKRNLDYLLEEVRPDAEFDQQPGLTVIFALDEVVPNENDRNVVGNAALWAAEGEGSSGVFVTMDKDDLLSRSDDINAALRETKDNAWELVILAPTHLPLEAEPTTDSLKEAEE